MNFVKISYPMLQLSTIQFLKALKKNNNREWFQENKAKYEQAKMDYLQFVEKVLNGIQAFDPSLSHMEPKKCVFRINRDVRFSKNKEPYKTNLGASFSKGGKKLTPLVIIFILSRVLHLLGVVYGCLWHPN